MFEPSLPLTMSGATAAQAEGLHAVESGETVFDLAAVTAVDSAAVAILLSWRRAAQACGAALAFHNPPLALSSLATLYGVSDLLELTVERH